MKPEFNPDGSIKSPLKQISPEDKEYTIIIQRHQKRTNNPAIAELFIEIPPKVKLPFEMYDFFIDKKSRYNINSNVHKLDQIGTKEYKITVQGVIAMYTWMEYFINQFVNQIKSLGYGIQIKGTWEKYESEQKIISPSIEKIKETNEKQPVDSDLIYSEFDKWVAEMSKKLNCSITEIYGILLRKK